MPLMNGWEFLARFQDLRNSNAFGQVTIMMLSSSSDAADMNELNHFDFVSGYVVKGDMAVDQMTELIVSCG